MTNQRLIRDIDGIVINRQFTIQNLINASDILCQLGFGGIGKPVRQNAVPEIILKIPPLIVQRLILVIIEVVSEGYDQ